MPAIMLHPNWEKYLNHWVGKLPAGDIAFIWIEAMQFIAEMVKHYDPEVIVTSTLNVCVILTAAKNKPDLYTQAYCHALNRVVSALPYFR